MNGLSAIEHGWRAGTAARDWDVQMSGCPCHADAARELVELADGNLARAGLALADALDAGFSALGAAARAREILQEEQR